MPEHRDIGPSPAGIGLQEEILQGLRGVPRSLPCKLFYDEAGSRLFDRICELPDYYPTRTEIGILHDHAGEMAATMGSGCVVIELGSGSSIKTRLLLDRLRSTVAYIPVDISGEHLTATTARMQQTYPNLRILPLEADYTQPLEIPDVPELGARRIVYFPGSTIGNFTPEQARTFLERLARMARSGGGLLLGVDLKKDPTVLHAAYNDSQGVTAAFNLNILRHVNRLMNADFYVGQWQHRALYNEAEGRIEMHLVSQVRQSVSVNGARFRFDPGETILTEYSYKYTTDEVAELARDLFTVQHIWTDRRKYFCVMFMTAL
jgi:dimethylhistidine N-methyltransferase